MKKAIPKDALISNTAKLDMLACAVEFIQFLTSEGPFKPIHPSIHPRPPKLIHPFHSSRRKRPKRNPPNNRRRRRTRGDEEHRIRKLRRSPPTLHRSLQGGKAKNGRGKEEQGEAFAFEDGRQGNELGRRGGPMTRAFTHGKNTLPTFLGSSAKVLIQHDR